MSLVGRSARVRASEDARAGGASEGDGAKAGGAATARGRVDGAAARCGGASGLGEGGRA